MCSESHYCTLVEYIICHAAFTGCHLAERLQCSWKPLSASNDIIKIGARGMVGARRRHHRGCRTHRQHRGSTETGSAALRTLLGAEVKRVHVLKGAEAPGIPVWSREPSSGLMLASWAGTPAVHPCPHRTSAHLLEGSNP